MFYINLETDRLLLKNISNEDLTFIFRHFSDDRVNEFLYDAEPVKDMDHADKIIKFYTAPEPRLWHRWIITRKTDDVKMGTCGVHCWNKEKAFVEIGYDVSPEYWGCGFAKEATGRMIQFAKECMNVKRINACIYINNERSANVVQYFGFKVTGKKNEVFRGKEYLHDIYTLEFDT